jgi:hypothetical protein
MGKEFSAGLKILPVWFSMHLKEKVLNIFSLPGEIPASFSRIEPSDKIKYLNSYIIHQ